MSIPAEDKTRVALGETTAIAWDEAKRQIKAAHGFNSSSRSIAFYEEQQPGLGARFFASVVAAIELAAENPRLGSVLPPPATSVRRFVVERFPFVVLVTTSDAAIKVVGVTHSRRRPDHWLDRIK
jgi:toxin ParE1/3/4